MKLKRLLTLFLIAFLTALFLSTACMKSRIVHGPRITSVEQLHRIGTAIRDYREEHGELPKYFSDLVPLYISDTEIEIFYVTNKFTQRQTIPSDWLTNREAINENSSYVYLGTNSTNGIIAFEKTNLWNLSASYIDKVAALFSDFHIQYVPISELQESLRDAKPRTDH